MSAGRIAFKLGRKVGKHSLTGRLFCLTERILPLSRIARSGGLIAFHHPRPIADPHVLIVPTRPVSSITADGPGEEAMSELIWGMIELGSEVTSLLPPSEHWQLVINGGARQDIGQMHAHLMHADSIGPGSRPLEPPTIAADSWTHLLKNLRAAERIPGNGFSLDIRWSGYRPPRAEVTQSIRR